MTAASKQTTTLIVGLSGCSCSGKSTFARLLRDIFPGCLVIHEDDFYKPESELPTTRGFVDWDCAEAIDVDALTEAVSYVRTHASLPPGMTTRHGRQDQEFIHLCPAASSALSGDLAARELRASLPAQPIPIGQQRVRVCIVEGFILFGPPSLAPLQPLFDVKCFVRASRARVVARRRDRDAYMCARWPGFWPDPPGYVDAVVWPNYVREHAWMFEGGDGDGDVEGAYDVDRLRSAGVEAITDGPVDADMGRTLRWLFGIIVSELRKRA